MGKSARMASGAHLERRGLRGPAWRRLRSFWTAPFTAPVPRATARALLLQQHQRLIAGLPLLCLLIAANALAMAAAVLGDLPWWQQAAPPVLIVGTCLAVLARLRTRAARAPSPRLASRQLRHAAMLASALGLVAGLWCVNAFSETERYYCMVAPVFIGIAALVCATCLLSVPRAAIAAMVATVSPIVIKMMLYDNLGVRAMALMMVLVTVMQAGVLLAKFRDTVGVLALQHELSQVAGTDPLTGIANRRAFMRRFDAALAAGQPVVVALTDLDGFKAINDRHGHLAGDAVLSEMAARMRRLAPRALAVARLGGDEFALLFDARHGADGPRGVLDAIRAGAGLPLVWGGHVLTAGISIGTAHSPADGADAPDLLLAADTRLYADKARRRAMAQGLALQA